MLAHSDSDGSIAEPWQGSNIDTMGSTFLSDEPAEKLEASEAVLVTVR